MKRLTKKCILPLLLAALCLLPAGCWSGETPEDGDSLDGLIGAEGLNGKEDEEQGTPLTSFALPLLSGESLDPITCGDSVQQMLLPLLYEGLFELDARFEPQPVLCANYSSSGDFTVWSFTVRDALFSNGSALTAEDVVFSLQRAKTSVRYGARLAAVSSIRIEGGNVVVTLSEGNNRFPALLEIPIIAKASVGSAVPIGTGPYRYDSGENGQTQLVKNETWWKGADVPVDTIPLRTAEDTSALPYLFSSHEIQMLMTDYTGSNPVSYKGNLSVTDAPTATMQYIGFNCAGSVFSDGALRRAVSAGIDRESICRAYYSGHAQSAQFPVAPASKWYPKALEATYSTESFQQAMTAAGYNEGHNVNVEMLVCDGNSTRLSAAKAIAAALSVYNLKVSLKTLPYTDYIAALQSGSFDLYFGEVRMTPDFNCAPLFKTGGSLNYGGFSDPTLDAQIATAFTSSTAPVSANEALCAALQQSAPAAVLCFKSVSVVLQGGAVDAITPTCSNPFYQLSDWQIHIKGEPTNG